MAFTFFFRDLHTLEHAVNYLLPFSSGSNKIKIWDAGCAMGQEPYTLAVLIAEQMGHFAFRNVHIDATDIDENDQFGDIVRNGVYVEDELKRIPEEIFHKYFFKTDNGLFQIDDKVKSRILFTKNNLLDYSPINSGYSLIVCKNVLLHLTAEERVKVIKMFHDVLLPGGFFVTEQTQPMPEENKHLFEKVVSDANLYKKV